ncbi:MAG: HD domain-containing protein [bacterium]|nr:HD domain-containing protein [bacterium]
MLKRVAVLGATEDVLKEWSSKTKRKDVEFVPVKTGKQVPSGASALIVDTAAAPKALELALTMADHSEEVFNLLADAIDCREDLAPGSSRRVREHATRFAKALKLSPEDQSILERGALVRDIGKVRIPNKVLLKDSMLTYDEWSLLHQHSAIGGELLQSVDTLKDVAEAVHRHHCCYDGTGYPDGLEGDDIPLLGRCLRILDVYCAMTSPRHYRETVASHKDALKHLRDERGKHFDPELVDAFIKGRVGKG